MGGWPWESSFFTTWVVFDKSPYNTAKNQGVGVFKNPFITGSYPELPLLFDQHVLVMIFSCN